LPSGSYRVTEVVPPEDYSLNPETQTFEWDQTGKLAIELTFKNYKLGSLEIYKYDAETNQALAGATFEVRKDGKSIGKPLTTGPDGLASVSGLEEGYYQVVEITPPTGYLKDDHPYEVYINPEDKVQVVCRVDIPNRKKLSLRVVKIDKHSRVPLKGFTFELFKDGNNLGSKNTNDNGEILWENLLPGTYRVHEANGPDEYIIDSPDQEIELTKDETEIRTLTFENSHKNGFWILKIDKDTGKPIPGVIFSLTRDGTTIPLDPTDENGYVKLENVEPGTYVVGYVIIGLN